MRTRLPFTLRGYVASGTTSDGVSSFNPQSAVLGFLSICCTMLLMVDVAGAAERGWLRYSDGNTVSGTLLEKTDSHGLFRADRFGDIHFSAGEASFEPAVQLAPSAQPSATSTEAKPSRGVWPDKWTLAAAADWKHENQNIDLELTGDLSVYWSRPRDDVSVVMRADYKIHNDKIDTNLQNLRTRWFHTIDSPWLVMGQLYLEHDRISLLNRPRTGYGLGQGSFGPGYRAQWTEDSYSRIVLAFNRFYVDIPDYHFDAYDSATSLFADNKIRITRRLTFSNWFNLYWWNDGDFGVESESELDYAVTRTLSFGLWHRYKERGVDVHGGSANEFRWFTKFTF